MRNLFVGIMAIAAFVACSNESVLEMPNSAIAFGDTFVQNSNSKPLRSADDPTYNNDTHLLEACDGWAFMGGNTGVVFNPERVTRSATGWTYNNTAYWTPNRKYKFAALAPVDHSNIEVVLADGNYISNEGALGSVKFTNVDGTDDLLYATQTVTTLDVIDSKPEPVSLMFKHLLSKVKFTFINGFVNSNSTMVISNVQMKVPAKGVVDLTVSPVAWSVNEGESSVVLSFGNVTEQDDETIVNLGPEADGEVLLERLTIPVLAPQDINLTYEVSFDVTLYQGDQVAYSATKTATIKNQPLIAGRAYNFTATLNHENLGLHPIEFTATVEPWVETIVDGGVIGLR